MTEDDLIVFSGSYGPDKTHHKGMMIKALEIIKKLNSLLIADCL